MRSIFRLSVFVLSVFLFTNVLAGNLTDEEFDAQKKRMVKLAEELVPVAEKLRGKKFKFHIEKGVYTREMIADYLIGSFEDELKDEIDNYAHILWKMGLTKKGFDLGKAFKKLYVSQVAGFYDPLIQELNIVKSSGTPTLFDKIAMVHELTHAIDDQHFDLLNFVDREKLNSDEQLAYLAVVEGTANSVHWDYIRERPSYNDALTRMQVLRMSSKFELGAMGKDIPEFLARQLLWPYTIGLNLAFEARKRAGGSFELIEKMFDDLPASSEQVLHPEKYFDERDNPVVISFEDNFEKCWGEGWEKIDEDCFGEYQIWAYFLEILRRKANIKVLAKQAAAGWDGDNAFFVLNKELDKVSFVWRLEFDTVKDAEEFTALYKKVLQKKYKEIEEEGYNTGILSNEKAVLVFETLPELKADEIKKKSWSAKIEPWKKPAKGSLLRYSEKYTPPTKTVESEHWNDNVYKEDWIEMTLPRKGFTVIYDQDFTMFMAPETERSEFVLTRMLPFKKEKLDKVGKGIIRNRINKGLANIKVLEETETRKDGYRWYYVIVGIDKNGAQRVSMTVVFEDAARKKLFQVTVHGQFISMKGVSEDLSFIIDNFRTQPAKKKLQTQTRDK